MRLSLHYVPNASEDGLWSVTADGLTVLMSWRDGPGELLRRLADLYEEVEPVAEEEWEEARQRLVALLARV